MRYAFGNFEFDSRREIILHNGVPLPTRAKLIALLADLIQRRGRLVYKQELARRIWPDVVVGATSLSTLVGEARSLLGDSGQRQAVIKTEAGRGYRFVAPVRTRGETGRPGSSEPFDLSALIHARSDVFASFDETLTRLSRGRPRSLLISGKGGSGKSALVNEFIDMARGRGFLTAIGRSSARADSPGLRPWIEILRSLVGGTDETGMPGLLAPDLRNLIQCEPSSMDWLGPNQRAASAQARFRILDSVCRFLTAKARNAPCVLIVEDLHWSDADSLALFEQLLAFLGESPLTVIGTLRPEGLLPGHPHCESLCRIRATPSLERIHLVPIEDSSPEPSTRVPRTRLLTPNALHRDIGSRGNLQRPGGGIEDPMSDPHAPPSPAQLELHGPYGAGWEPNP